MTPGSIGRFSPLQYLAEVYFFLCSALLFLGDISPVMHVLLLPAFAVNFVRLQQKQILVWRMPTLMAISLLLIKEKAF